VMRRLLLALIGLVLTPALARAQETVEYYGADMLGSVRVVFDPSGGIVARTDYMPFGEEVFVPGAMPKERFTTQDRDGEAAMDYFHARMLQPRTGRFASVDPLFGRPSDPQQWNRYAYAGGSPTFVTDPTGMFNVDTNCRQSQGAYYCPGAIFIPDRFNPSSVDQIFDGPKGYQGGESINMAEMGYASGVDTQFANRYMASLIEKTKKELGPGEVTNDSGHTVNRKPEEGDKAFPVPNGRTLDADGMADPELPTVVLKVGNGLDYIYYGNQDGRFQLTLHAFQLTTLPILGGWYSAFLGGSYQQSGWFDAASFLADRHAHKDYTWDALLNR
jgi:RHS repeat-associated protein